MLASPDSAEGGLGRARVVSLGEVLFSFFVQIAVPIPCLFERIIYDANQFFGCMSSNERPKSSFKSMRVRGREFNSRRALLFFGVPFFVFFFFVKAPYRGVS